MVERAYEGGVRRMARATNGSSYLSELRSLARQRPRLDRTHHATRKTFDMSEPDLKKLPDDVLIRELKDRGHAVCVFQVSDFADALSVSYDLESLSERTVDALASKIMKAQGNFLRHILCTRGTEAITDRYRKSGV